MPYTLTIGESRRISIYARTPERALDVALFQEFGSRDKMLGQPYTLLRPNGTMITGYVAEAGL